VTALEARQRGATLIDLGRPQEALAHLQRALAAEPGDWAAHALVALAHLRLEHHPEAEAAAQAAIRADPEQPWPQRLLAIALLRQERDAEGRAAALEACRLDPLDAQSHVVLAASLQATGDEAGAVRAATHAIELDPESAEARRELGVVLLEQGRNAEAIPALEAALALDPEHAGALNDLAVARLRARRSLNPTSQFEAAAALDPRLDVVRHNILATGPAGRSRAWRRWSIVMAVWAVLLAVAGAPGPAAVILAAGLVFEAVRALELRRASPATRELLRSDNRARRWRPGRWGWGWVTRLRPWWWLLLMRLPPPVLLTANVALLGAAIATPVVFWIVAFGLALPFSARRALRWWRRRHPPASSWRP
jgi:tetratricopeptide (TPR) repeat protein